MRRPGWRPSLFLTAASLFLTAVPAAPAQQKPPSPAFLNGTEVFRRILFDAGKDVFPNGFQPLDAFGKLDDPPHSILIVLGDSNRLTEVPGGLEHYVEGGGVLFLATDRPLNGEAAAALRRTAGVQVSGTFVLCDNPEACYHQLADCPFLRPDDADADLFRNLMQENSSLSTVATNAPSYLEPAAGPDGAPFLPELATLPPKCYPEGAPAFMAFRRPPLFAVKGGVGDGRVLVMADHSVFINEMMLQKDNGNIEFAYNALQWMIGDEADQRTKVLFVEDGQINTRFEVPLKEVPDELADRLLDFLLHHIPEAAQKAAPALERGLKEFDQRGGADEVLWRFLRRGGVRPDGWLRFLAVTLAVLAVLYGCWKVGWKARHGADLQGPLLASALYRLAPSGTVAEQRRKALIHADNLWEPARDLARQFLTGAGVQAGAAAPRVEVRGGWLRRWTTAGRVKRLWRLAHGAPARLSLSDWHRLLRDVKSLQAGLGDGTVRFT